MGADARWDLVVAHDQEARRWCSAAPTKVARQRRQQGWSACCRLGERVRIRRRADDDTRFQQRNVFEPADCDRDALLDGGECDGDDPWRVQRDRDQDRFVGAQEVAGRAEGGDVGVELPKRAVHVGGRDQRPLVAVAFARTLAHGVGTQRRVENAVGCQTFEAATRVFARGDRDADRVESGERGEVCGANRRRRKRGGKGSIGRAEPNRHTDLESGDQQQQRFAVSAVFEGENALRGAAKFE